MGTNTYGYVFDPIGNRITTTNNADILSYTANSLNQYTAISNAIPMQPVYDDDGNMTATGDGWHYEWNGENRLVLASNETTLVSYAYDHQRRMVWKSVASLNMTPAKSINYLWDGYNIITETILDGSTTTNTTYNIWGLGLDGTLQRAGGVGGLLVVLNDFGAYAPAWDANCNVTEYVSAEGTIVAHREYDLFGGTVVATGNTDEFTHWFSTKPWCPDTGLSEYQFRKYCPVLGRWMSRDPMDEIGGANVYEGFFNDPVSMIDPLGENAVALYCGKENFGVCPLN